MGRTTRRLAKRRAGRRVAFRVTGQLIAYEAIDLLMRAIADKGLPHAGCMFPDPFMPPAGTSSAAEVKDSTSGLSLRAYSARRGDLKILSFQLCHKADGAVRLAEVEVEVPEVELNGTIDNLSRLYLQPAMAVLANVITPDVGAFAWNQC